jgi:CheY-like chemotaxis protein
VLDYLNHVGQFTNIEQYPFPHLILLDLNLPKRDGREVLKIIKEDPNLNGIPVVIVSTSDREEDVSYAFNYGVVAYISKAMGFDRLSKELGEVTKYARRD